MKFNIDYDHDPQDNTRYRFMCDDNYHWYLIPVGEEKQFETWLMASCEYGFDNYKGKTFNAYRLDARPEQFTIADPRRNEIE